MKQPTIAHEANRRKTPGLAGVLVALSLLATASASAAIELGDTIVIDFGKSGQETGGNWNNRAQPPNDPDNYYGVGTVELIADLVRFSDGAPTGVSLTKQGGTGAGNAGIGGATVASVGADAAFTVSGTIPDEAQIDVMYVNTGAVTLEFAGLDDTLIYDIEFMSKLDAERNPNPMVVNGVEVQVALNDAPFVVSFPGISTDGEGKITISFPNAGAGVNLQHINAIELTAVDTKPLDVPMTLSGFTYDPANGGSEVSLMGIPSTAYILVEAADLDFANPSQSPVPLAGATVGTLDGNQVITDATGDATVQFNLGTAKPATFIRGEQAPSLLSEDFQGIP